MSDYLLGSAGTTEDYCTNLIATGGQHNLYNLLLGDFRYSMMSMQCTLLRCKYFSTHDAKMMYHTNQKDGGVVNISPGKKKCVCVLVSVYHDNYA